MKGNRGIYFANITAQTVDYRNEFENDDKFQLSIRGNVIPTVQCALCKSFFSVLVLSLNF